LSGEKCGRIEDGLSSGVPGYTTITGIVEYDVGLPKFGIIGVSNIRSCNQNIRFALFSFVAQVSIRTNFVPSGILVKILY
jgi:hypothetical protein